MESTARGHPVPRAARRPNRVELLVARFPSREFLTDTGYSVDLRSEDGTEHASVRLVEGEDRYVTTRSNCNGSLIFRALGFVVYALGENNDNPAIDCME
jgi:hypothetical protein